MVGSETRNARAISSVVRPPRRRSVSAARASAESTGWQDVKISRRRSSPTSSSSAVSRSTGKRLLPLFEIVSKLLVLAVEHLAAAEMVDRAVLGGRHQPGAGVVRECPEAGHCSSAATSASWARSSASPTSRTIRARPAMIFGDSMRQTASIARWVSVAVTATDHTTGDPRN